MEPAFVVGIILGLLVVTAIGAIILRAAVSLFNKIAGRTNPVQEPSMLKAMGIVLLSSLVNGVAGYGLGLALSASGLMELEGQRAALIAQLASIPLSALIMAAVLSALLPTTFLRGLVITVLVVVVYIAILLAIGLVVALVTMVLVPR